MATAAQITANRVNSQKSTGPRTPEGKLTSSRNALIHGFSGRISALPDDEALLYVQLSERYIREMQPSTLIEEELLKTIADSNWQLNKLRAAEEQITRAMCGNQLATPGPVADLAIAFALRRDCEGPRSLEKLARYRAHFQRSLHLALKELERLRSARQADSPHSVRPQSSAPALKKQPSKPPVGFDLQSCDSFQLLTTFKEAIFERRMPKAPDIQPKTAAVAV